MGGDRHVHPLKAHDSFAGQGLLGSALSCGGTIKLRPLWGHQGEVERPGH